MARIFIDTDELIGIAALTQGDLGTVTDISMALSRAWAAIDDGDPGLGAIRASASVNGARIRAIGERIHQVASELESSAAMAGASQVAGGLLPADVTNINSILAAAGLSEWAPLVQQIFAEPVGGANDGFASWEASMMGIGGLGGGGALSALGGLDTLNSLTGLGALGGLGAVGGMGMGGLTSNPLLNNILGEAAQAPSLLEPFGIDPSSGVDINTQALIGSINAGLADPFAGRGETGLVFANTNNLLTSPAVVGIDSWVSNLLGTPFNLVHPFAGL